jgi:hypothetical protein
MVRSKLARAVPGSKNRAQPHKAAHPEIFLKKLLRTIIADFLVKNFQQYGPEEAPPASTIIPGFRRRKRGKVLKKKRSFHSKKLKTSSLCFVRKKWVFAMMAN